MKRWIVLAALLLIVPQAVAQVVPSWTVWLYDKSSGYVTEFDPQGTTVRTWKLPGIEPFQLIPDDVFVSPSGAWMIYTGQSIAETPYTLVVHEPETGSIRHQVTLEPFGELGNDKPELFNAIYDEARGQVALGYFAAFYGAEPANTANWEIGILDLESGHINTALPAPPQIAQSFTGQHLFSVPVLQRFVDGVVEFAIIAGGTENDPDAPTYAWDIRSGDVQPIDHYTSLAIDLWPPTGEIIFPAQREGFGELQQCAAPGIGHMPFNVVEVYDPAIGNSFPVIAQGDYAPRWAAFVQNGQRILVAECSLIEAHDRLTLYERDGTVVSHYEGQPFISKALGTPDGFVYLSLIDATLYGVHNQILLSALMSVGFVNDDAAQTLLWLDERDPFSLSLVHVQNNIAPPGSYREWQQLSR